MHDGLLGVRCNSPAGIPRMQIDCSSRRKHKFLVLQVRKWSMEMEPIVPKKSSTELKMQ